MTKHEEFLVPVSIAKKLKEIGFDKDNDKIIKLYEYESKDIIEPTWEVHYRSSYFSYYLDHLKEFCPLFTYEQVFTWFRSKGLFHSITIEKDLHEGDILFSCEIRNADADIITMFISNTYEEAREELLKRLIEIYKENI